MCGNEISNAECGFRNAEFRGQVVPSLNLRDRTKAFALEVVGLVEDLPRGRSADSIGNQLLRSGPSVGANYRAACRARSKREFVAKLGIVEEEADESQFWMDLIIARGWADTDRVTRLREEAQQLVAIIVASIRTARRTPRAIPHSAFRNPH
jgi:four helix bundle protein